MGKSVRSVIELGLSGTIVEIECHISNSLPAIVIVGSASRSVDEAKERVRSAFVSSALQLPRKRIAINLAPADIPKTDSSFDLAIAVAILRTSQQVPHDCLEDTAVIGELGFDGSVRAARGIIGKLLAARKLGVNRFVIPATNLSQAQLVPDISLIPVANLKQLYTYLTSGTGSSTLNTRQGLLPEEPAQSIATLDLGEIIGQEHAKRALEIAAAGGHNIFFSGPPGTGKSMLAKALPGLLPALTHEEMLEVTHLHSLATNSYDALVTARPFRAPHHSASLPALIGGGTNLRPGEVSLGHRGVLFLDEMPEFDRTALEALRQPLEDHVVTVARAKNTVTYPAQFTLVATANPCPCGYYGSSKPCTCLPHQIARYQQRISGPILDRIDLHSTVQGVDHQNLLRQTVAGAATTAAVRQRIVAARNLQAQRYHSATRLNGDLTNRELKAHAKLTPDAKDMLDTAASRLTISARSYMKIVKVARTIADLEAHDQITTAHLAEALQYRRSEQPPAAL